jgi:hypothetical protein
MSLIGSGDRNGPIRVGSLPLFHLMTESNPASATSHNLNVPKTTTDTVGVSRRNTKAMPPSGLPTQTESLAAVWYVKVTYFCYRQQI